MVNIIYGNKTKLHYGIESETNRGTWISFPGSRNEFIKEYNCIPEAQKKIKRNEWNCLPEPRKII